MFFIPWRVVAEESGAAHFGLGGAMLLDPFGHRSERATGSTPPTPLIESRVDWSLRRAFSPTFRAGAMAFFIPWRVVAEESGAAHFGFGGAMLLDPPVTRIRRMSPAEQRNSPLGDIGSDTTAPFTSETARRRHAVNETAVIDWWRFLTPARVPKTWNIQ